MCDGNAAFEKAAQLITGILDDFPAFVFALDKAGNALYQNNEAVRLTDMNQNIGFLLQGEAGETRTYEVSSAEKWYRITDKKAEWINGEPCRLVAGFDITDAKYADPLFRKAATIDAMTGILNRQTGMDYLEQLIEEVKTGGNLFTICYMDINDLRFTNESYGRDEGDEYIKAVVSIIKNAIRQTDIFARVGDDEFLVIFPKCRYDVVDNIMGTVMNRFDVINETSERQEFQYSVSYGLLEVNQETELSKDAILKLVEREMMTMKDDYKRSRNN